jgi:hypothetical protein
MLKRIKTIVLSALMVTLGLLIGGPVRADDNPATQPTTKPTGSITVTVVDANNKPVAGATVRVTMSMARGRRRGAQNQADAPAAGGPDNTNPAPAPAPAPGDNPAPARRARPQAVAQGTTDENGVVKFDSIPAGNYNVSAMMQGIGRGRGRATIDPATNGGVVDVRITLRAGPGGPGGPPGGNAGGPTAAAQ